VRLPSCLPFAPALSSIAVTSSPSVSQHRSWLFALVLIVVTFIAYFPVWHGGFLWDDEYCVPRGPSSVEYYTLSGLHAIWFHPARQYYPLSYTLCWLEYHVWGFNTTGYHLMNILLHSLNAILVWLTLRRLKVPGAWLAGGIFALHPVNVESVAWIIETKNVLSCLFYLCAIRAALKFWLPEETGVADSVAVARLKDWKFFWLAYVLFVCALLSKTSTVPLPAVILLLVWWKRGKISLGDVYPLLLFVATAVGMGVITRDCEGHLGVQGNNFQISMVDRCLIAGRDFWFYLGKLFWPHPLILIYPHWKIAPSPALAWLSLLALGPVAILLWLGRKSWGRAVFVALAYFAGMLFLMLGFFNIAYFAYSYVADHFQYLAMMGPLALVCAGIAIGFHRLGRAQLVLAPVLATGLFVLLGTLTWQRCRIFSNLETLLQQTVARNPEAYAAHADLGYLLMNQGELDAALEQFQEAEAIHADAKIYYDLGNVFLRMGKPKDAIVNFRKILEIQPDDALAYAELGNLYLESGQLDSALECLQRGLEIHPKQMPMAWYNLGNVYIQKGQPDLAIKCWQNAVAIEPDFPPAHNNLGNVFLLKGQVAEAVQHWRSALAGDPNMESAQVNLAWVLATCPQASLRNGAAAVQLAERANEFTGGKDFAALRTLAAAYAEEGRFPDAVTTAREALQIASLQGNKQLTADMQGQLKFYQNNQPFRDATMVSDGK
jgi:protein O-mannosyl-transferase